MKSPETVLKELIQFAEEDSDIRAVIMNGSRVNINVKPDCFQDYDVVFFILHAENEKYKKDHSWISRFGELVICQQNDFSPGHYIFLMQFKDGTRIELSFKSCFF